MVQQLIRLDSDLIEYLSQQLRDLEQDLAREAKIHEAFSYHLIRSVPGIGHILTLVILYEIEDVTRFPTAGQFASYARMVKRAKESAGKMHGYSGKKIGNAYLKWAFSEAGVLFLKNNSPAQKAIQRLASKHGKGKALSILAHKQRLDAQSSAASTESTSLRNWSMPAETRSADASFLPRPDQFSFQSLKRSADELTGGSLISAARSLIVST